MSATLGREISYLDVQVAQRRARQRSLHPNAASL